ncbi:MAG TPA: YggS family pyridoxal phosphate-dependent enzyme [Candidatus Binataceae bacterium]|nr:YggS family pyridoxal phosphate-dependent enzyme [Candidatus Binataceae bacterium]
MDANEIARRLGAVRDRIEAAARRAGCDPHSVRLVAASKMQPSAAIRAAYAAGARHFGENYVQEALSKQVELSDLDDVRWHLIGHLQTNKAKIAAGAFDLVQSLDSIRLADALAKARPDPPPAVLVEVNLGGEASKTGVPPDEVEAMINAIRAKVEVRGLMAIPPPASNPEHSRTYFVRLRGLRDRLAAATGFALSDLSMGMSDDFEIAIEEGATIVRVGRAIFGERPQ